MVLHGSYMDTLLILVIVQTQVEGLPPRQVEIRGEAEYFSIKLADVHFQNALRLEIISHRRTSQGGWEAQKKKLETTSFSGNLFPNFGEFGR